MKVLDLFSGLGGFSQPWIDKGHTVTRIDNNLEFKPDIVADLATFRPRGYYDIILASPPCTQFARWAMPESFGPRTVPDMTLLRATMSIIAELEPEFWIIENVRGARMWFYNEIGQHDHVIGPYNFWTNIRGLRKMKRAEYNNGKGKWLLTGWGEENLKRRPALRSKLPYPVATMVMEAVTNDNSTY